MVACFDAVRFMGFRGNFSRGGKKSIIPGVAKIFFQGKGKVTKIHYTLSKLRKRLFAKNLIGKC